MQHIEKDVAKFKARVFKALGDPIRLQIMLFLREGEKCVCEIVPRAKIAQPLVSRHLKILKDCGLVNDRKDGNRRLYSVADPRMFAVIDAVTSELVDAIATHMITQMVGKR
ncbi:MAG: metalloregulator ArsR/SmtB family transcription factor [Candidatus Bathyarchaeota archaeon]|nr:metalloregulator ArsR/SmtB family transcription factor [Candidatus Bathyarchaeota archaeon]